MGVPVLSIGRWLWIGGTEVWVLDDRHRAGPDDGLAGGAAVLTVVLALPIAIARGQVRPAASRAVEATNYVTSSLPGIVTALALVTVTIRWSPPLYQTVASARRAYVLLFMPRALVNLRSGLAQVPVGLEEVAQSLGKSPASPSCA